MTIPRMRSSDTVAPQLDGVGGCSHRDADGGDECGDAGVAHGMPVHGIVDGACHGVALGEVLFFDDGRVDDGSDVGGILVSVHHVGPRILREAPPGEVGLLVCA